MRVGSQTKLFASTAAIREPETRPEQSSAPVQTGAGARITQIPGGGFRRIPTYAVGRTEERRSYIRVRLSLSLRVQRIAGQREGRVRTLRTVDVSSSGVYFLSPRLIEPGTPVQLDVLVVDRPLGRSSVRMQTEAHIVRAVENPKPGWYGLAAAFDDICFVRDEPLPPRFRKG